MIPARRVTLYSNWFAYYTRFRMRSYFNRLVVPPFEFKEGHSILLICNHFSWWDGLWANYLAYWHIKRKFYVMIQEDQLRKRKLLSLIGGFSINRNSREMIMSLQYAANLLKDKQNLVVMYPQGAIISNHTQEITVKRGLDILIKNIKGPCQVVYSCTLVDYFESLKPSVFFHLFDCGTADQLTFQELTEKINTFHRQALKDQLNVRH